MGKAEDRQTKADDLGGGPQADRGGTASEMGQGKARRLMEREPNRGGKMPPPLPDHLSLKLFAPMQIELVSQVLLRSDSVTREG
jgi:hypothetical protein